MSARFAIGFGARRGVDAQALAALVVSVAERAGVALQSCGLFTLESKRGEAGMDEASRLLQVNIVFLPLAALLARKDDVLTKSPRVEVMTGVGSVAEAAALAGAGPGSVLLAPRATTRSLTCAIARGICEGASS